MKRFILLFMVVALIFGVTNAVADNGIVEPWQMSLSEDLAAEQVQQNDVVEIVVSFEGIIDLGQTDISGLIICAEAQELRTLGNESGEHPTYVDQRNFVPLTDDTMSLNGRRGSFYTQLLLMKHPTFQEQMVTRSSTLNSMVMLIRS